MRRTVVIGIILSAGFSLAFSAFLLAGQMEKHHGGMVHGTKQHGEMGPGAKDHEDVSAHLSALTDKWDPKGGKAIYERLCLNCHGPTGKGDGPTSRFLTPKPSDFSAHMPHHGEDWVEYYFKVIKEGGQSVGRSPIMPAWGAQLKDSEVWDVVSYLHTFMSHP